MKTIHRFLLLAGAGLSLFLSPDSSSAATQIIADNFNVTGSGSGFGLNTGVNTGINPPTTRLTGTAASGLRYINTGTKATTAYTITSSKAKIASAINPGRFTYSSNGTNAYDLSTALGISAAKPGSPVVYDLSVSMDNDSAGTQRCSFALGTAESDAFSWDFGVQIYRAATTNTFYTIGKRIDSASAGLTNDLNAAVYTMGASTFGTEITILIRVTDAGFETTTYNSRVQMSLNGGSTWFYDTDTDANLPNGFHFDGPGRVVMWDIAPDAVATYDNFSLNWISGPRTWTGGGADSNWSTSANWSGLTPGNGSPLTFSGTVRQSNTNDITSLNVPSITINTGGFSLNGNALTVTGSITNTTGNSALNAGLTLGGAVRMQVVAGTLTIGSAISGANSLTKDGAGILQLGGTTANTYSGNTIINAGTVSLAKSPGVDAIAGNVTVGDGLGGAGVDILQLSAADQIDDASTVTVSASGTLNLNSFNETVAAVSAASAAGQILLGSGTLTVGDANASTFAGSISGSGALVKQGTGTLTLSGANSYSGGTTISAGTLALGAGGSLTSPSIALASGAAYNVSGVSGYSLSGTQTLSRNSASGAGTVTGPITFASGAKASFIADGTSGSVGTLTISGNLTLNANVITINVTGSPLASGLYSLISYTGTKTGSFNLTPVITGAGLDTGLTAKIVETAGLISVKVLAPAHGVSAASIKVVENDLANTTNSVEVTTTVSINGMAVRDGSSRGDYTIQVGAAATDDLTNGVVVTSVAENGRDNGEESGINYCTSAISSTASGYFIPTSTATDGSEYNINVSAASFPYSKWLGGYARNSAGTAGGANNLLTSSPGIVLGTHFVDNGGGLSTVNLTGLGVNSQTDGVLLVTGGGNNNEYASSKANTDGTWSVYIKDNGTNGSVTTQGPVAFVFVPRTNVSIISGKFHGDGSILMYNGSSPRFSVTNTTNGTWKLTIPGYSSSKGVLLVSAEGGGAYNADNIVSAQPSGSDWIIQSRDVPGLGLQTPPEPVASFVFIPAPTATLVSPANNANNIASAPSLKVTANSTLGGNLNVTFYGHRLAVPGPGPDFLIPVLPDTQNYARESSGSGAATKEMWFAQTDWIVANRVSENIPFVATLGDCVNNADQLFQWRNATNAMYRLEKQSTTKLIDGIPYGITVGNHDQDPNGDPDGSTAYYNQYFGTSHFSGKSYYGGHYSTDNDSWYDTFSAGGLNFLVISFEYGRYGATILDWANDVIAAHPTHRVIVLTHHAGDDTPSDATVAPFSAQGSAIYNALKGNANFFLMLGGHVFNEGGEGRRSDTYNGHTVKTLISDYQGRFNGGNGLMRLMYFSPANNLVSVKTYSPYTDNYETDANSQFSFSYNMQPNGAGSAGTAYAALKTNINVVAGTQTSNTWSGLIASRTYEWYVTVTDEVGDYSTSPEWKFTTTANYARPAYADTNNNGIADDWEAEYGVTDANADNDGDGQNNLAEYLARTNPTNAASVFRMIEAREDGSGEVTLKWTSVGGVRYRVQYADEVGGDFNDIIRNEADETDPSPLGESSTQMFTDSDAGLNQVRFYRVKVVP